MTWCCCMGVAIPYCVCCTMLHHQSLSLHIPCMQATDRLFRGSACHGLHSHPGTSSWPRGETHHIQTDAASLNTARECHLDVCRLYACVHITTNHHHLHHTHTTNLYGCFQLEQVGLGEENFLGCDAQHAYFIFRQLHLLARLLLANF